MFLNTIDYRITDISTKLLLWGEGWTTASPSLPPSEIRGGEGGVFKAKTLIKK